MITELYSKSDPVALWPLTLDGRFYLSLCIKGAVGWVFKVSRLQQDTATNCQVIYSRIRPSFFHIRNSFLWSEIISLVPEVAGISLGSRIFYKLVQHKARQNETGQSTGKKKTPMFLTSTLWIETIQKLIVFSFPWKQTYLFLNYD